MARNRGKKTNYYTFNVYTIYEPDPQVYTDIVEWSVIEGNALHLVQKQPNDKYVIIGLPMDSMISYLIEGWRPPVQPQQMN